jgi:hypothetical protein
LPLTLAIAALAVPAASAGAATGAGGTGAPAAASPSPTTTSSPTTTYVPPGATSTPGSATTATPGTATTPAGTATTPGAATTPTVSIPAAPAAAQPAATTSGVASAKQKHGDGGLSTGAIAIAAVAALLVLLCIGWALARRRAFEPHWLLSLRHAMAEAGFRASATWSEFADWARLGR